LIEPEDENNTIFEISELLTWHNKPKYTGLPDNFHFGLNLKDYCGIQKKKPAS